MVTVDNRSTAFIAIPLSCDGLLAAMPHAGMTFHVSNLKEIFQKITQENRRDAWPG